MMNNVYVGGTFDLFHAGHVNLLKAARRICHDSIVTVALNLDRFCLEYKGVRPICTYDERKAVLESCRYVDRVIPNTGGRDSREALLLANAQVIVVGSDWEHKDYYKQMGFTQAWLDHHGIRVEYVPYYESVSTTALKYRILQ